MASTVENPRVLVTAAELVRVYDTGAEDGAANDNKLSELEIKNHSGGYQRFVDLASGLPLPEQQHLAYFLAPQVAKEYVGLAFRGAHELRAVYKRVSENVDAVADHLGETIDTAIATLERVQPDMPASFSQKTVSDAATATRLAQALSDAGVALINVCLQAAALQAADSSRTLWLHSVMAASDGVRFIAQGGQWHHAAAGLEHAKPGERTYSYYALESADTWLKSLREDKEQLEKNKQQP